MFGDSVSWLSSELHFWTSAAWCIILLIWQSDVLPDRIRLECIPNGSRGIGIRAMKSIYQSIVGVCENDKYFWGPYGMACVHKLRLLMGLNAFLRGAASKNSRCFKSVLCWGHNFFVPYASFIYICLTLCHIRTMALLEIRHVVDRVGNIEFIWNIKT